MLFELMWWAGSCSKLQGNQRIDPRSDEEYVRSQWVPWSRCSPSANLKLSSVMSDVMGVSGREMLRAIVEVLAGYDTSETGAMIA